MLAANNGRIFYIYFSYVKTESQKIENYLLNFFIGVKLDLLREDHKLRVFEGCAEEDIWTNWR
jgi:hypothetical protein